MTFLAKTRRPKQFIIVENTTPESSNTFSWKFEKQSSLFVKKQMREHVSVDKVDGYISNKMGIDRECKTTTDYKYEQQRVEEYRTNYKQGHFQTSYRFAKHGWGRINPIKALSTCVMRRLERHSFCKDRYIDIDMKNAQPALMYEICKMHDIPCDNLKFYVENTAQCRSNLMDFYGIDKDTAKQLPIRLMFGGSYDNWLIDYNLEFKPMPLFVDIETEMKAIMEIVYTNNQHIVKDVLKEDTTKWATELDKKRGTTGLWCQTVEQMLQENAINYLVNEKGFVLEDIIPCQDGFMILNDLWYDGLLKEICEVNKKRFNISVDWDTKEFDQAVEIPDAIVKVFVPQEIGNIEIVGTDFDSIVKVFEQNHCLIINKSMYIKSTSDTNIPMSKAQLISAYEYLCFYVTQEDGKSVCVNFIKKWIKNNMSIRKYEDIGLFPNASQCPKNIFNSWRPFAMELVKDYVPNEQYKTFILEHIKILCNHEKDVYDYFIKWIAQMIQYPEVKSINPTFISNEGAGKTSLIVLFKKMLGDQKVFETTEPSKNVWGQFNGIMANAFLVNLNELSKNEMGESEGKLKGLVTDNTITINYKGINQYIIQSVHRFITSTNELEFKSVKKGTRRECVIRCSDELCNNTEYFTRFYEYLNDVNNVKTIYEYFKSIPDMDKFKNLPIPVTEHQSNLQELSTSSIETWLQAFTMEHIDKETVTLLGKDSYGSFCKWCGDTGCTDKVSLKQFGVRLTNLRIKGVNKGTHTKLGETKVFNIVELMKHFHIEL